MKFILSLTVVTAAVLVAAVPASATVLSTSNGTSGTKASFVNTGAVTLTVGSSTVTCLTGTVTGTISGSSASATPAGISWGTCTYTFLGATGVATVSTSTNWTVTVTTCSAGSCTISVTQGTTQTAAGPCSITLPIGTYSGTTWTNATHSTTTNITGVSYTASGAFCPLPASGTDGKIAGSASEKTITVS